MHRIRERLLMAAIVLAAAPPAALAQDPGPPPVASEAAPVAWAFPKDVKVAGRRVSVREPTVLSYDLETDGLTLRFATPLTDPLGKTTPGMVEVKGTAHLDLASRLFLVDGMEVTGSAFLATDEKTAADVQAALPEAWPTEFVLRLELLTARPGAAPAAPVTPPKLSPIPPRIIVRNSPSVLIQFDGEPVLEGVESMSLQYVLNTASDLFFDPGEKVWILLLDGHWATAPDLAGPWAWLTEKLPVGLSQLNISHPRGHVRRYVPGTREYRSRTKTTPDGPPPSIPEVIVTEEPAELVLLRGDPLLTLIPGVNLLPVANTESDLFLHPKQVRYYLCLSGRWYVSDDLQGEWKPSYGLLPEEFREIPRDHGRSHVLASVPGTHEAEEAAALASLRERFTLKASGRSEVRYDGLEIRTAPVDGSDLAMVTNTEDDVLVAGGTYYLCVRGVWFASTSGRGGWEQATELNAAISDLPPGSSPYHLDFCRPAGAGEAGNSYWLSGGYFGVYVMKGGVVHGTGWSRPGLLRNDNWYPQARTYGENRWYDARTGMFRPRTVRYGPDGNATADLWSPYTAGYGRVIAYADRYRQGGRRMFPYRHDRDEFQLEATRPDIPGTWTSDLALRSGLPLDRFPLGDRRQDPPAATPAMVADGKGHLFQVIDGVITNWNDGAWTPAPKVEDDVRGHLEAFARIDVRPAQWAAWQAERAAPVPVNPRVTPRTE